MKTLVFIEQRNGVIKQASLEALSQASRLAGDASEVAAVIVGKGVAGLIGSLSGYGAYKVYVVEHDDLELYTIGGYTSALAAAQKAFAAELVLASASPMGKDLLPRLAARADGALATDIVDIKKGGDGQLEVIKPLYAGKCLATQKLLGDGLKLASLRPNVFKAEKTGQGQAAAETLSIEMPELGTKTLEIRKGQSTKADLTEASVIISGGRSLANAENFKILEECADAIGATVGASRAAVDAGYAPHDMQVGQTGKTVNPNLYIACGISGAIQHLAGMRTSKVIVAINSDPEAPIFQIADYGIVADLFEAVPALTEAFKKLQSA